MSLRTKFVLALVLLASLSTIAIGALSYRITARQLNGELNRSLAEASNAILRRTTGAVDDPQLRVARNPFASLSAVEVFTGQYLGPAGRVRATSRDIVLPVGSRDRAVATAEAGGLTAWRDVEVDGESYRVLSTSLGDRRGALQVGRSLEVYERVLDRLLVRTVVATLVVVIVAAAIGWLLARQVTERLRRLTAAAEDVATTGRLDTAVPTGGRDETGRLSAAFDRMLVALATSREDQRRLVQDAGHELRTPLTSLRTNIDVLQRHDSLDAESRAALLADLDLEARELSSLVDELVDLATERRADEPVRDVLLADAATAVVERTRRRTGRDIVLRTDDSVVVGRQSSIERAVSNLVDNAVKFDEDGVAPIEVEVAQGRVTVSDRGQGLGPEDVAHMFGRFYRSESARSRPGSGLGLSIVAAVAESHGGTVFAAPRHGGGAVVGFQLPVKTPS